MTTKNPNATNPKRGEVWRIDFDPTQGSEINKTRPAIVLSSDGLRSLPVRLVVPVTAWKSYFESNLWHVQLKPTQRNGLYKSSAADALQVRSVDVARFQNRMGRVSEQTLEDIVTAVAVVIEYE